MTPLHRFLKPIRAVHLYLGVFVTPALMFFAITGGLQTFGLHEAKRGGDYKPPAWLMSVAQLHKKQTTVVPVRRPRAVESTGLATSGDLAATKVEPATGEARIPLAPATGERAMAAERKAASRNLWPMKFFFGLVALSLLTSTLTGLYMAYRYSRKPRRITLVLLAGILVPLFLLLF
jgi:hypothetical protein